MRKKLYIRSFLLLIAILLFLGSFYSLPYYVSKPGMAKELEPIIKVENGTDEEGSFMLTTVRMGKANIYSYLLAKMNKYQELYPINAIRSEEESEEEYNVRQLHLMAGSKQNAIEVAYKKAGIPIHYIYKGVYVLNVVSDMPAMGKLLPGDRIFKVDNLEFDSSEQFIQYVAQKVSGDKITLTYERGKKNYTTSLAVKPFKDDPSRVGVGIALVDDKEIKVKPDVTIKTDQIGGPSAGFMFSLEIYNQLVEEDLTKGYQIAGTGTMESDGTVGRIGGIEQKIIAADKAGAEIFLAPNENGAKDSNYREALKTAKDIKTDMKIIPVNNFEEAVNYLEDLKPKK